MGTTPKPVQLVVIAVIAVCLLSYPGVSFARTRTVINQSALISQLQTRIKVLEAQIAALLAAQSTSTQNSSQPQAQVEDSVRVSVDNAASMQLDNSGVYTFVFGVKNNASTTVYIPLTTNTYSTGTQGFVYSIQGNNFSGSQNSTTTCPSFITLSTGWSQNNNTQVRNQGNFCAINPGQTMEVKTVIAIAPANSGNYSIQVSSLNYTFSKQPVSSAAYSSVQLGNTANTNPVYITSSVVSATGNTSGSNSKCAQGYTVGNTINTPLGMGWACIANSPGLKDYTAGNGWACRTSYNDCSFGG